MTTGTGADHLRMVCRARWQWCPGSRCFVMTQMTLVSRIYVCRTLTARGDPIVTTYTVIHKRRVINGSRNPCAYGMTGIALRGSCNVCRAFARCYCIVMTTTAHTKNFIVINSIVGDRYPRCWCRLMTGFAHISSCNVGRTLAAGDRTVVTTETGANHLCMINCSRCNRRPEIRPRCMASITDITGVNVIDTLATGNGSVVTAGAGSQHLRMVYGCVGHWYPWRGTGLMAGITGITGSNVCRTSTTGNRALLTTEAGTNDMAMIHGSDSDRYPGRWSRCVAGIAGVGAVNMRSRLAGRESTVMTTGTNSNDLIMIDSCWCDRYPGRGKYRMTQFTVI